MDFLKKHWFILCILLCPLPAWYDPSTPLNNRFINSDLISQIGVAVIFFITGLGIDIKEFFNAARNFKLNGYINIFCFLFFPLLVYFAVKTGFPLLEIDSRFESGLLIMSILPITIASCVSFTKRTGGDFHAALFNAMFGNLAGLLITPYFLSITLLYSLGAHINPVLITIQLGKIILLPIVLGYIVRIISKTRNDSYRWISEIVMIGIIYFGFCKSFSELNRVTEFGKQIVSLIIFLIGLHFTVLFLSYFFARCLNFNVKEIKAIMFTTPQKTVAIGIPLAMSVGHSLPGTNMTFYLLPLLLYNNMQWMTAALMTFLLSSQKPD